MENDGPRVIDLARARHIEREGFTAEVLVDKTDGLGFSALVVDVFNGSPPKQMVKANRNYFVLEGAGLFVLNGVETVVQQGDLVVIPDGGKYSYTGAMKLFEFNFPPTDSNNSILIE